jgi:hypothetical protein
MAGGLSFGMDCRENGGVCLLVLLEVRCFSVVLLAQALEESADDAETTLSFADLCAWS